MELYGTVNVRGGHLQQSQKRRGRVISREEHRTFRSITTYNSSSERYKPHLSLQTLTNAGTDSGISFNTAHFEGLSVQTFMQPTEMGAHLQFSFQFTPNFEKSYRSMTKLFPAYAN